MERRSGRRGWTRGPAYLRAAAFVLVGSGCGQNPAVGPAPPDDVPVNAERHRDAPAVVLVSFDGFRHDYMDRFPAPNFRRVADAGVRAESLIPVYPSKTFPNHYSIATGMYAETHRLVGNRFWDPDRGAYYDMGDRAAVEDGTWYGGEPIWVTAETQGMVSASYFFVGSEADVGGVRPSYWYRYDGGVSYDTRVDQVLTWLSMPAETRPHMITLYFSTVDSQGHRHGPDSPEVEAAVGQVDGALGRLLDGIESLPAGNPVYVILVSDHGMMRQWPDSVDVLDLNRFPDLRYAELGPYGGLWVDGGDAARVAALRDSLQAIWPRAEVYLRQDVPERFHYSADPRIGDLVVVEPPGRSLVTPERNPPSLGYNHGWDNQAPEMGGIFLAMGPGIGAGQRIASVEAVHVYPFMAHLLGLTPNPAADGRLEVLLPVLQGGS